MTNDDKLILIIMLVPNLWDRPGPPPPKILTLTSISQFCTFIANIFTVQQYNITIGTGVAKCNVSLTTT